MVGKGILSGFCGIIILFALSIGLVSCSDDVSSKDSVTRESFVVSLSDGFHTRVFGDGSKAVNLKYALYHSDEDTPMISTFPDSSGIDEGSESLLSGSATITVDLVHDEDYTIVFWADSFPGEDSPYSYDTKSKSITVNYSGAQTSDEGLDSFFGSYSFKADGGTHSVKLRRAMAQVNVGSADIADAAGLGVEVETSSLTFSELSTSINLVTGKSSGIERNVKYGFSSIPKGEVFPAGAGMEYLGMAYILVGTEISDQVMIDLTVKINGSESAFQTYSSIPVRRNYRTNIFGKLLTNPDNFNIKIDKDFGGSSNN